MTNVNESGRSMVEMLGVLAIIGVLSIGGIAGYTMAMNRYRANEVIDAASKMAVIAMTKQGAPWTVSHADIGLADDGIAGTDCVVKVESEDDAKIGSVTLTGTKCTKAGSDVLTAITSIAGSSKFNSTSKKFRFDGESATASGTGGGDGQSGTSG